MHQRVAIVYNDPSEAERYDDMGESQAILGVLDEVEAVRQSLEELGCEVELIGLRPPLEEAKRQLKKLRVDAVFNLFEGFGGRPETESAVAYLMQGLGLDYTGCPAPVLALALNKVKVKTLLSANGISTPQGQLIDSSLLADFHLDYPCIVKPAGEDASHGISDDSVVYDFPSLQKQLARMNALFGSKVLVEEFIDGQEFNVTVMGKEEPKALPVSEIVYTLPASRQKILTYAAKWNTESIEYRGTRNVCPAPVEEGIREEISRIAVDVYRLMGCAGYARVDFRQDEKGDLYVIDVNPNPDIAPDSGAARQIRAAGMSYTEFIERTLCGRNRYSNSNDRQKISAGR